MARFTVDIPGMNTITVDGNFATEESINKLAAALKMKTTKAADAFEEAAHGADDIADAFSDLDPVIGKSTKKFRESEKAVNEFYRGFSKVDGMFSDLGDPGSGSLTKLVKSVGDASSGLVAGVSNFLGPLGSAAGSILSGLMGAATGIATTAIGFAQGLVDVNKTIHNAGLGMAGGLKDMQQAAADANVPFQQFANAMIDSSDSLRLFAGGAPGGIKAVSQAMGRLTKGNRDQYQSLLAMGYTTEDIVKTMADLGAQAGLAGQSVGSFGDLAQVTDQYLRTQQELNRLTGVDIKQARERQRANNASLFVQNRLNKIQDPTQRAAAESILNRVPASLRDFVASGQSFTQAGGIMSSQMPALSGRLRELYQGIESGAITQEEVDDRMREIGKDPALAQEVKRMIEVFGAVPAELFPGLDIAAMEELVSYSRNLTNASQGTLTAFDYARMTAEGMDKSIASMEQLTQDINSGLSTLGFTLFNFVDGFLGRSGDYVGGVAQKFQDVTNSMDSWKTAQERYDEAVKAGNLRQIEQAQANLDLQNEKINNLFGTNGATGPLDALRDKMASIFSDIKDSISSGIQSGFSEVLSMLGYTTSYKEKEMAKELIAATSKINEGKIEEPATITSQLKPFTGRGGSMGQTLSEQQKKIQELYESFENMSEQDVLGLGYAKRIGAGGKTYYDKLSVETITGQTIGNQAIKPQALGGIFEPRPGGHVIRVAEAMSPELVAPASKGADGRLGLEISGVHLDNSKLLARLDQSNVETNKLLNSLISVNSAMLDAMNKGNNIDRQAMLYAR